jgi:DNA repair exonuclease SbcCD ATPase subunit
MPGSEAADTLKGFLNAANAFRTSASTFSSSGSTTTAKNATVLGGSVFGDPLSEEKLDKIKRWIPAPTERGSEGSVTDVASSSGWNGSVQDVESLPQLMSVLENVTQMADRFQALEKQKHFTKDEEIRLLRERCKQQEKKSKELEQEYTATNEDLKKALMYEKKNFEFQREYITAELRKREKKISEAHDILAKKNDNLLKELEKEIEGRNTLTSEVNHLRENFTRERAAFEGTLERVSISMADLLAREKELTEEKDILKGKNETLENEKWDLIQDLSHITTQNSGLKQEFEQHKAIWQSKISRMRRDFELQRTKEAEDYAAELAEVQAKYSVIVQELKEEKAELITKNTVAQAALIEKVESISLAVPQMMQDLVRNLSKQATGFKDGCASLTRNMKETSSEDTGESGVVKERKPETRQSGQAATKEGHGPEKAATPLPSVTYEQYALGTERKGVKGPSRSPKVGSNTEDDGCVT